MFAGSTIVEALDLHNGTLVFRSKRDFAVGAHTSFKVAVPSKGSKLTSVDVEVASKRSGPGGTIYTAHVLNEAARLDFHVEDASLREAERARTWIRVMSRNLPQYRAIAVDVSATGAQLETDGPVDEGRTVDLRLDLDNYTIDHIACSAEVMWCRPALQSDRFRVGVRFAGNTPEVSRQLKQLSDSLDERAHADLHSLLDKANLMPPAITAPIAVESPASGPPENPLLLPLRAALRGYRRGLPNGSLRLTLMGDDGASQELEFVECHCFFDASPPGRGRIVAMRSSRSSPLLTSMEATHGHHTWKHYQLLDENNQSLVEIVAVSCRAGAL